MLLRHGGYGAAVYNNMLVSVLIVMLYIGTN